MSAPFSSCALAGAATVHMASAFCLAYIVGAVTELDVAGILTEPDIAGTLAEL